MALHQIEERTSQLYIALQARMPSQSCALSSANGLQVNTHLWNLMLPFTQTGQITSSWKRIHLEFYTICPLSYFFSSLNFPTSLTLDFLTYLPYLLYCTLSGRLASPVPSLQSSRSILNQLSRNPFAICPHGSHSTHLHSPKPTVTCGNQARIVLLMCTDVSSTPTH